ncbi:MAG: hypothetical protein V4508_04725, partial [Pseudomonadota bacterium]
MSYILEALKKAQAERQLGSAPTIHSLPLQMADDSGRARRHALWIGLALGVLAASAVLFAWTQRAPAVQVAAIAPAPVAVQSAPPPVPAP